jgi:hypothetical protein
MAVSFPRHSFKLSSTSLEYVRDGCACVAGGIAGTLASPAERGKLAQHPAKLAAHSISSGAVSDALSRRQGGSFRRSGLPPTLKPARLGIGGEPFLVPFIPNPLCPV